MCISPQHSKVDPQLCIPPAAVTQTLSATFHPAASDQGTPLGPPRVSTTADSAPRPRLARPPTYLSRSSCCVVALPAAAQPHACALAHCNFSSTPLQPIATGHGGHPLAAQSAFVGNPTGSPAPRRPCGMAAEARAAVGGTTSKAPRLGPRTKAAPLCPRRSGTRHGLGWRAAGHAICEPPPACKCNDMLHGGQAPEPNTPPTPRKRLQTTPRCGGCCAPCWRFWGLEAVRYRPLGSAADPRCGDSSLSGHAGRSLAIRDACMQALDAVWLARLSQLRQPCKRKASARVGGLMGCWCAWAATGARSACRHTRA